MLAKVVRNEDTGQLTIGQEPHPLRIETTQIRNGRSFVFEEMVVVLEDGSRLYCFFLQHRLDGLATRSPITAAQICNRLMTIEQQRSSARTTTQVASHEVLWGV